MSAWMRMLKESITTIFIKKYEKMRKEDFFKKGSLDLHIRIIAYTTKRVNI
jgi:hypothetical protein